MGLAVLRSVYRRAVATNLERITVAEAKGRGYIHTPAALIKQRSPLRGGRRGLGTYFKEKLMIRISNKPIPEYLYPHKKLHNLEVILITTETEETLVLNKLQTLRLKWSSGTYYSTQGGYKIDVYPKGVVYDVSDGTYCNKEYFEQSKIAYIITPALTWLARFN